MDEWTIEETKKFGNAVFNNKKDKIISLIEIGVKFIENWFKKHPF